ncbi:hypothetical protein Lesp02_75320 [Lentzea sp. NBRC 105346]|uniref:hypothetical protein n=1 Tax=Lentzea sp. NBRC 105346 TaxID=3032205 RepID=UPI0024A48A8F|nr:hypothetical protein [Lentzea sp. NBRC 105346]GLZ35345.1 hypothetical protein Lesp02_75320 [Lentzea sp. NBRC 105346]
MRVMKVLAAAALALAATLVVPAAANAVPSTSMAPGAFAIWDGTNFTGLAASMVQHTPSYGNLVYAGTNVRIDNTASSAANYDPDLVARAYRDPQPQCDFTAFHLLFLRKGQVTADASWFYGNLATKGFDNTISGHCFG